MIFCGGFGGGALGGGPTCDVESVPVKFGRELDSTSVVVPTLSAPSLPTGVLLERLTISSPIAEDTPVVDSLGLDRGGVCCCAAWFGFALLLLVDVLGTDEATLPFGFGGPLNLGLGA